MTELKVYQRSALDAFSRWLEILEDTQHELETAIAAFYYLDEDVKKYRDQDYLEKEGQDVQTLITISRLRDLNVGELIRFSYLNPESYPSGPNLIRYQNEPLIIDNFKNKSYPSRIDNTLEDSPIKHDIKL